MTITQNRADEILSSAQDLTRDLESHLGLAARSREWNPTFENANEFVLHPEDLTMPRRTSTARLILEYRNQLDQATVAVQSLQQLTSGEETARAAVLELVAAVQSVTNHDDAVALVATFEG